MNHETGFSLVEVLASLLLVTTLALSLLHQQMYCKQFLQQLILRGHRSETLKKIDELRRMGIRDLSAAETSRSAPEMRLR